MRVLRLHAEHELIQYQIEALPSRNQLQHPTLDLQLGMQGA